MRSQNEALIKKILATPLVDVNARDLIGATALHLASWGGLTTSAALLIDRGRAQLDTHDEDGLTPLHVAARAGHVSILELLVAAGADKDALDKSGGSPLHWAVATAHDSCAMRLIDAGARLDVQGQLAA